MDSGIYVPETKQTTGHQNPKSITRNLVSASGNYRPANRLSELERFSRTSYKQMRETRSATTVTVACLSTVAPIFGGSCQDVSNVTVNIPYANMYCKLPIWMGTS